MLARTPFTEVEIEGVGTYRLPNQWQLQRVNRLRGLKRYIAVLAVGCGMTERQFMKLPDATKAELDRAYLALMSPRTRTRQQANRPSLERCQVDTCPSTRSSPSAGACYRSKRHCHAVISAHGWTSRKAFPAVWPGSAWRWPQAGGRTRGTSRRCRRAAGRNTRWRDWEKA